MLNFFKPLFDLAGKLNQALKGKQSMDFNDKLKSTILESVNRHVSTENPSFWTCEIVQNEVMDLMGFDLKPFLKDCGGYRSGIKNKIKACLELSEVSKGLVIKLTPEDAQKYANDSTGEYIVLALMSDKLSSGIEKDHVAFVIGGKFSSASGPCIGGGGMTKSMIDKGWVLSTASIHFTDWKKVNYFSYGYKE
jgi:hypothetical protein